MPVAELLKDLPSSNKANFSSVGRKLRDRPVITRSAVRSDDEKKIIFDKKPLLLRYLQANWGTGTNSSTSSIRIARSERKRASDPCNTTSEESEQAEAARTKTRRRE